MKKNPHPVVDLVAAGFPHDKAEGVACGPGNTLFVTDDDDFGITTGSTLGVTIQKACRF